MLRAFVIAACFLQSVRASSELRWVKLSVKTLSATATVIYRVNNRTNTTVTSMRYGNAVLTIDTAKTPIYTPMPTNGLGTPVTSITTWDQSAVTPIITTVAYPTIFDDYDTIASVEGNYPVASPNGTAPCTYGPIHTPLPSHPPFNRNKVNAPIPSGVLFTAMWVAFSIQLQGLFTDVGYVQSCTQRPVNGPPPAAVILTVASFLTDTEYQRDPGHGVPSPGDNADVPVSGSSLMAPFITPNPFSPDTLLPQPSPADTSPAAPSPTPSDPLILATPVPNNPGIVVTASPNLVPPITIGGQPLVPGGPEITVSGTKISLPTDGANLVIGPSTVPLPTVVPEPPPFVLTAGGNLITVPQTPGSPLIIVGQTLIPGGPEITVSGTPLTLPVGATSLVVGTNTIPLAPLVPIPAITVAGNVITAPPTPGSPIVVAGRTLIPGGPEIAVSGTPISLPIGATNLVIGPITVPLTLSSAPTFTIAGFPITAGPSLIIDGQTLLPGGPPITISGTRISLAPFASYIAVGSSTFPLNPQILSANTGPTPLAISHETLTANSLSQYIAVGQTLAPSGLTSTTSGSRVVVGSSIGDTSSRVSATTSPANARVRNGVSSTRRVNIRVLGVAGLVRLLVEAFNRL
ncbi:MAG: hypothetical protein M1839_009464 [Geoglossum umbratile]|nr:MAG: hypothetical protein M1839_009464 [Geoglossum umbratile]